MTINQKKSCLIISKHFNKFAYKMDFLYKSMKLRRLMVIYSQLLGYSPRRLPHLVIRIILIIFLQIRKSLSCFCNMEYSQVLIVGLLISMRSHLLFNWQDKAMMYGLEIVEEVNIVGNIKYQILMERMDSSGNLVFKRWENMMCLVIQNIFVKILGRKR